MLRTSPFHIYLDHIETAANSLGYKVFMLPLLTKGGRCMPSPSLTVLLFIKNHRVCCV